MPISRDRRNTPWWLLVPALVCVPAAAQSLASDVERLLSTPELVVEGQFPSAAHDADGDGISDLDDNCPGTPAFVQTAAGRIAQTVDGCGCPLDPCETDADADGVPDCRDRCPATWPDWQVDALGCPLPIRHDTRMRVDIKFPFASARIRDEDRPVLDAFAQLLERHPELHVVLEGHTDWIGSAEYNLALSQARARAVRDYLVFVRGIAPERLRAVGFGESRPIADNRTEAGRARNRRMVAEVRVRQVVPPPPPLNPAATSADGRR